MSVAIIDYGSGNLHSAAKAFERAARDNGLAVAVEVTADPAVLRRAERLVLPGVGAFKDCRNGLMSVPGLWQTLEEEVVNKGKPFLGICVGMQLLADEGVEHGSTRGLGWIGGTVRAIAPAPDLKIPHMGWNDVMPHDRAPLIERGEAYFLHGYHFDAAHEVDVLATTDHGGPLVAAVGHDNIMGVQFHPEKSQTYGINFLKRFLEWMP